MTQSYLLFLTAVSVACSLTARAELLFSSLDSPSEWIQSVNNPNSITNRHLAAGFTTGDSGAVIESIRLSLWNPNLDVSYFSLPVRFYTDDAGKPGISLGIFANIDVIPNPEPFDPSAAVSYPANGPLITLAAHTTYWLVLEALEDTPFQKGMLWSNTTGAYESGPFASVAQPSKYFSQDFAATMQPLIGGGDFQFALEGTSVPEPAATGLLAIATLGLCSRRKRSFIEVASETGKPSHADNAS